MTEPTGGRDEPAACPVCHETMDVMSAAEVLDHYGREWTSFFADIDEWRQAPPRAVCGFCAWAYSLPTLTRAWDLKHGDEVPNSEDEERSGVPRASEN